MRDYERRLKKTSIENYQNDLNEMVSKIVSEIIELDKDSWIILKSIGQHGPQNQYSLTKKIGYASKTSIKRRIDHHNGLLAREFLYESPGKKHRTGTKERIFGLTFKGFVASLGKIKFEENYLIQHYHNDILVISKDKQIADLVIEYLKYNLALILLWHKINGLKLTEQKHMESYFSYFNELKLYDKIPFHLDNVHDPSLINTYTEIRSRFLAIQILLAQILQNVEKRHTLEPYDFPLLTKKVKIYRSKSALYYAISDWIPALKFVGYYKTKRKPESVGVKVNRIYTEIAQKMANDILKRTGFEHVVRKPTIIL